MMGTEQSGRVPPAPGSREPSRKVVSALPGFDPSRVLMEQGSQRIEELRVIRDDLRRVLENVLRAFCDPMTRRMLGGHNEDQQCAVIEAREVLRRAT